MIIKAYLLTDRLYVNWELIEVTMNDYCNHLFDTTTDGYIQVMKLDKKEIKIYNTQNKELREVVEIVENEADVFVTPNTMYRKQRRVSNIRQFRALFQDLDIHKLGYNKEEVVWSIYIMAYENKIPMPTMIVDSGRGLHVYWKIKNAPFGALNTWQELQDYLYYQLRSLEADRKALDGARVLRLPNTLNSRENSLCKVLVLNDDIEYSMYDLREAYLNYSVSKQLEFQETKTAKKKTKIINNKFFNSYSLHMARVEDIETLCKLRKYNVKGYRNMIIHCYAYWKGIYIRDIEELENEVIELNNSFLEPMKETEIRAVLRCVPKAIEKFINYEQGIRNGEDKRVSKGMRDKEGYWYKNETLIDRLEITEEEQRHMKTIIGTQEKYRRNNERRVQARRNENGLTKKQQELADLKNKVLELREQGLSIRKIAENLGKSKGTIENILKK